MHLENIEYLFRPRSVAIIGASERNFYARNAIERLEHCGFSGPIYLVNPNAGELFGRTCHATPEAIGAPFDMAFIAVPRRAVLDALRGSAAAGARAAVVVSNGFSESADPEGSRLQQELSEFLAHHPIALCGPSCLGIINVTDGFQAFGGHRGTELIPGSIGLVSQSGANVHSFIAAAVARNLSYSFIASSGNEAGLEASEYIDFYLRDSSSKVVCAFVESFKAPERLPGLARRALEAGKPLIIIKIGRSEPAARAALAHTGSMTGSDAFYDTLFRQHGIIRADTIEEALDCAAIFAASSRQFWPSRGNVGIVSISGGFASTFSDLAGRAGLDVPQFGAATTESLSLILPSNVRPHNPIDISTQVQRDRPTAWAETIDAVASDPAIDLLLDAEALPQTEARLQTLLDCRDKHGKPVILTSTSPHIPILAGQDEFARRHALPVLLGVESSLRAVQASLAFTASMKSLRPAPDPRTLPPPIKAPADRILHEVAARGILHPFGIAGPREHVVKTAEEAESAARQIGVPVAIKVIAKSITHRSDTGLVKLNVAPAEARTAAADLIARMDASGPHADYALVVQEMVRGVAELFIGVSAGAGFAPMLIVGIGGLTVELLQDRVSRIAPIDLDDARAMLRALRLYPLLAGYRGAPAGDVEAAARAILAMSQFALAAQAWLSEAEINPLVVRADGLGVCAVDALIVGK